MIYQGQKDPTIALGGTYRIPNMTTTQKDASNIREEGALIYDTTLHKLCVYTGQAGGAGTKWETITSVLE